MEFAYRDLGTNNPADPKVDKSLTTVLGIADPSQMTGPIKLVLAGLGFTYLPEHAVTLPGLVLRPVVEPEVYRTVSLVTVRGRPHSPGVGALVREAMHVSWAGQPALAVEHAKASSPSA